MWKKYVWNLSTCNCENGKYLASIMDDSAIICDEIIDVKETNFNKKKKKIVKRRIFIFYLLFY